MQFSSSDGSSYPLVISMGDPHGIGPEVVLKSLASQEFSDIAALVVGSRSYLVSLMRLYGLETLGSRVTFLDVGDYPFPPRWGEVDQRAGELAVECITRAVQYCRQSNSPLLVTAPIHKTSARLAGMQGPGHTEFLGSLLPGSRPVMAFLSDYFHLALVTTHIPLSQVCRTLNSENVENTCRVFHDALRSLGLKSPKIAVAGLNPHASEGGLFGAEERTVLVPALDALDRDYGEGVFSGPLPPDTVFREASMGRFDGVVALYHDQGLAPLKLVAFDSAANVTLGLPLIRTSPDHGTAFEIAGKGVADPSSMASAIRWGLRLSPWENSI